MLPKPVLYPLAAVGVVVALAMVIPLAETAEAVGQRLSGLGKGRRRRGGSR